MTARQGRSERLARLFGRWCLPALFVVGATLALWRYATGQPFEPTRAPHTAAEVAAQLVRAVATE